MLNYPVVGQNRKSEATDKYPGLPPNARRSPRWHVSPKAAMRQRARAWVIPMLCQGGIHYCLTRVRGRRRTNGTSSGRGIPGGPAARKGKNILHLAHPVLHFPLAASSSPFSRRSFRAKRISCGAGEAGASGQEWFGQREKRKTCIG